MTATVGIHELLEKATIVGEYKPKSVAPSGIPHKLKVKFSGESDWIEYKR